MAGEGIVGAEAVVVQAGFFVFPLAGKAERTRRGGGVRVRVFLGGQRQGAGVEIRQIGGRISPEGLLPRGAVRGGGVVVGFVLLGAQLAPPSEAIPYSSVRRRRGDGVPLRERKEGMTKKNR